MTPPGSPNPNPRRVQALIEFLATETQLGSLNIAETLWLALKGEPAVAFEPPPPVPAPEPPEIRDLPSPEPPERPEPPAPPPPEPRAEVAAPPPQAGMLPTEVLPIQLADPALLHDPLALIRALRPLLQPVVAGLSTKLDEPATVDCIARTGLWLPVLAPAQSPWFDVVLVFDAGPAMYLWRRLEKDLRQILRRYGAFRDLRLYDLAVNRDAPNPQDRLLLQSNSHRPGHRPSEIIDRQGHRLVLVLSDCAAPYWWDGTLVPLFEAWGQHMPTVVWQMLPPWLWSRTALGRGTAVSIRNDQPGAANARLHTQPVRTAVGETTPAGLPLPVITSDPSDLTNWSRMVAGDCREATAGVMMAPPSDRDSVPQTPSLADLARDLLEQLPPDQLSDDPQAQFEQILTDLAQERVRRFIQRASPAARRLVMLLAAAPVITPPIARLIRDAMLPGSGSPLPVAEVFLGGLLQRLPHQDDLDPNQVQYNFVAPQVRQALLGFLPAVDTVAVINQVSAAIEARWPRHAAQSFRAFLFNPEEAAPEDRQGLIAFARITATILEPLGGEYAAFARRLRGDVPDPIPFPTAADPFPLTDDTYEVVEVIDSPALEPFEFIDAQFEETPPFPPPLQDQDFTIVTFEDSEAPQPFEFTVATLRRSGQTQQSGDQAQGTAEWVIERQQQQAYRLIEILPGDIPLEMVIIPGGTFLMGSPPDEPGRRDDEGPQHQVTVPTFCMGRYPITQGQWRAVATLPKIEQELNPDPAQFKGDIRPVEQVSWDDAAEFCARLSAHADRAYRLPSEAEWEYACRAGTTTPFHFGETLASKLANYDGRNTYAGGPKGQYRRETTPVDHFGIANPFGLTDMHGNVREWCQDTWHSNYEGVPTDGSAWLGDSPRHVRRGGSWDDGPRNCRSAYRFSYIAVSRDDFNGFRVCCAAPRLSP
jgi:formylglycine-generating enzyme required for sulfatase activity